MHETTAAVRALYERYPYPAGPITLRIGFDVRRALSFIDAARPHGRPLWVLDAGCGRASGLLGMAMAQPDIQFVGLDINRTALREAQRLAQERGLTNVRFVEGDLEQLTTLNTPADGFDLIVSSGVVHHLVDPTAALARLGRHLAPWGALDLMVYARAGRVGIERVADLVAASIGPGPVETRLAAARALVDSDPSDPDFIEASGLDDVEFVDRYLHPQFVSYSLDELRELVEGAGLSALRWADAATWDEPGTHVGADLWEVAAAREPMVRPRTYDLLLAHPGVAHRDLPAPEDCARSGWALNGEGQLQRGTRTLWASQQKTAVTWSHPTRRDLPLAHGPAAVAASFFTQVDRPFRGEEILSYLEQRRVTRAVGCELLRALARLDVLWCPHEADLMRHRAVPRAA